jgi:hypothetical protein
MPAIRTNHLTEPTVTRPDDLDSLRVPAILSIATRIDAAHKLGERGRKTSVRLIDHAGRAVNTWTYGTDPYPPFF